MIIAQTENIEYGMYPDRKLVFAQIKATKYIVGIMFSNGMLSESKLFNNYKDAENSYNIRKITY